MSAAVLEIASRLGPQHVVGWEALKRDDQVIPWDEDWLTALFHSGRGAGKTLALSHAIDEAVHERGIKRLGLIAPTATHAVDINVNGDDGIIACSRTEAEFGVQMYGRPQIAWKNGAVCRIGYASNPTSVRGPSVEILFCDEYGHYPNIEDVQAAIEPTLRLGDARMVIATTPNLDDVRMQRHLLALAREPDTFTRQVSTFANRALSRRRLERLRKRWAGTTMGRQELEGEIIIDAGLSLWQPEHIVRGLPPDQFDAVVISLDPNKKVAAGSDNAAIVVGGIVGDRGYILHAEAGRWTPKQLWDRLRDNAVGFSADILLVEDNAVGDFFGPSMRSFGDLPLRLETVTATIDKRARAYDALGVYEQGRVTHCTEVPALESEMMLFTGVPKTQDGPDDLVDALVHLVREYLVTPEAEYARWSDAA